MLHALPIAALGLLVLTFQEDHLAETWKARRLILQLKVDCKGPFRILRLTNSLRALLGSFGVSPGCQIPASLISPR